ncbi:MAG: restriction endonuclease, partial [Chloroflexota bacterium]
GIEYHFYSDLEKPNKMDGKPFLIVNLLSLDARTIDELKRFTKTSFDLDDIMSTANELKYKREIGHRIEQEFQSPSAKLVRLLASEAYEGNFTSSVVEQFTSITKDSLKSYVTKQVNKRLKSALEDDPEIESVDLAPLSTSAESVEDGENDETDTSTETEDNPEDKSKERDIHTTQEELEGYFIVKTIMREIVDSRRVTIRDTMSYCGVLFDDNNRKPICRLHFNRSQKYIGLFDENKKEDRIAFDDLDYIFQYADRLKETANFYE